MPAYQVQNGDTLRTISLKVYGTDVFAEAIAEANHLGQNSVIAPGMLLKMPDNILPEIVKTASPFPWAALLGAAVTLGIYIYDRYDRKHNRRKKSK